MPSVCVAGPLMPVAVGFTFAAVTVEELLDDRPVTMFATVKVSAEPGSVTATVQVPICSWRIDAGPLGPVTTGGRLATTSVFVVEAVAPLAASVTSYSTL